MSISKIKWPYETLQQHPEAAAWAAEIEGKTRKASEPAMETIELTGASIFLPLEQGDVDDYSLRHDKLVNHLLRFL